MQHYILLIAAALMFTAVGCGSKEAPADKPAETKTETKAATPPAAKPAPVSAGGDAAKGKIVYTTKGCVACHGADGKGNGGVTGADFVNDKKRLAKSDAELIKSITDGKTGGAMPMPPQKDILTAEEIKDVTAFLRTEFAK